MGAELVFVVAVRVAVVDDVEPVPGPALAVARRGEQGLHQSLVGIRGGIGDEGLGLLRRRRQTGEIEIEPADKRAGVGGGRRVETLGGEFRADEGIDRIFDTRRRRDGCEGFERPPIKGVGHGCARGVGPSRTGVDPRLEGGDFRRRECFALGRHSHILNFAGDKLHQRARGAESRHDIRRAAVAAVQRDGLHIEAVAALLFFGAVAFDAMRLKNRAHVAHEIGRSHGKCRGERPGHECGPATPPGRSDGERRRLRAAP